MTAAAPQPLRSDLAILMMRPEKHRAAALLIAGALATAATARAPALASEFADKCVAAGQGMLTEPECRCVDENIAESDQRADLTAFFDANIAEQKGGPKPDENSPELKRGFEALNGAMAQCMK